METVLLTPKDNLHKEMVFRQATHSTVSMAPIINSTDERLIGLDKLRGLAVFLVLCHHAAFRFPANPEDIFADTLRHSGWIGVDIFFVISGFMISKILIRDMHQNDLQGFFIRRLYRIAPLLLVAVGLFTIIALATGKESEKLAFIWSPALMLNGWTIPFLGYGQVPFTITWSLSVEETAYSLLGFSCLWLVRGLRVMLITLLLVSIVVRFTAVLTGWMGLYEIYFFVPARLDGIALGGLGALGYFQWVACRRAARWWAGLLTIGLIWIFQFVTVHEPIMAILGYFTFALACGIWVTSLSLRHPSAVRFPTLRVTHWAGRFSTHFGQLSYFIYLFHLFVLEGLLIIQRILNIDTINFWTAVSICAIITYLLAVVSWHTFEAPIIHRGRIRAHHALRKRILPESLG